MNKTAKQIIIGLSVLVIIAALFNIYNTLKK
jgi:hypothetical protein